ncbi:hypothetical protein Slin15195_G126300 [Septoria linicola]|uniref:Uncharacterized protein n=1 Tax=Septoria linicola TaxID=215465 RepID=A0A9Q9EQ03_9PEZI|nr:hypothetical protein Slin14017_G082480 [Septoria linicola]USW59311.1 hypothetical protein Slin15195_G126300 [Septoria linicola]
MQSEDKLTQVSLGPTIDDTQSKISSDEVNERCYFMELSGELRNRIYRLLLKFPASVQVTLSGHDRPAIVCTSKTIRSEALGIFYLENSFHFSIHDLESDNFARFTEVTKALKLQRRGLRFSPRTQYTVLWVVSHWDHLLLWLKRYHAQEVHHVAAKLSRTLAAARDQDYAVVAGMFVVAKALRGDQPWSVVERIFNAQRPVLAALDAEWAKDKV